MKRLLLLTALVLWAVPAHAQDAEESGPCTGKVGWYIEKIGDGLYEKGAKFLEVRGCGLVGTAKGERMVLKACPVGARCSIEFTREGDEELGVISVKRVW